MNRKRQNPSYRIPSFGRLRQTSFAKRGHIIAPWLKEQESAMVYAPAGVGKSMFTLSLALAVAGGGEVFGWSIPKPRRVLFVDGEMPMDDILERAEMLKGTVSGLNGEALERNLQVFARHHQNPDIDFPDLAEEEGRSDLLNVVRRGFWGEKGTGFDLVILDNLSTLASIKDENSASEFNDVVKFLSKLKQAKVACILVHHSGKHRSTDKEVNYRGSSKLATTFEVMLGLSKVDSLDLKFTTAFELQWQKYRGKRDETIVGKRLWLKEEEKGQAGGGQMKWMEEKSEDETLSELVALVQSMEYTNQGELAEALKTSPSTITRMKRKAIQAGLITEKDWDGCLNAAKEIAEEDNPQF